MRKKLTAILAGMTAVIGVFSLTVCSTKENEADDYHSISIESSSIQESVTQLEAENDEASGSLNLAIKNAIIEQNKDNYLSGEFYGTGYKIIEVFDENNILSIYALTEFIEYQFQDGVFVNISGTNPKVYMQFKKNTDGKYELIYYTRLDILSGLTDEELEELMQPLVKTGKDYLYTDADLQEVREQADNDARTYLQEIGRAAEVGNRERHDGKLLAELVSNQDNIEQLMKDDTFSMYPNWVGTLERIENEIRYIYKTEFIEDTMQIIYTKIEYDTNNILEKTVIDTKKTAYGIPDFLLTHRLHLYIAIDYLPKYKSRPSAMPLAILSW